MKRKILALLLALVVCVSVLSSCGYNSGAVGEVTLVIGTEEPTEFTADLSKFDGKDGVFSLLLYLKEEGKLDFEESGGMLKKVGELSENPEEYVYLYLFTSVEKDFDVSEYKKELQYKGKTLTSSGVGAKDMTLEDGAVIYIGTVKYEW